jgi:hypothetical protein
MNDRLDLKYLTSDSRARVYLVWAFITGFGFAATHYYQHKNINYIWLFLAAFGLIYMLRVMPLRVKQMRNIYLSWLIPISIGLLTSILAAQAKLFPELIGYLGVFWLVVSATGYFWNGLFDQPSKWYFIVAVINIIAAGAIYFYEPLLTGQYLLVAIISAWSMLMLWLFRSDAW